MRGGFLVKGCAPKRPYHLLLLVPEYLFHFCCDLRAGVFNGFAALAHAVVVRFSEDPDIVRDLLHLEEDLEENAVGVSSDPLARVRRAVLGMLHADDAGIVSAEGLAKMMTVTVAVFEPQASQYLRRRLRPWYCEHWTRYPVPHCSSSRQEARGIHRQRRFCIWAVLSTEAPILVIGDNEARPHYLQ